MCACSSTLPSHTPPSPTTTQACKLTHMCSPALLLSYSCSPPSPPHNLKHAVSMRMHACSEAHICHLALTLPPPHEHTHAHVCSPTIRLAASPTTFTATFPCPLCHLVHCPLYECMSMCMYADRHVCTHMCAWLLACPCPPPSLPHEHAHWSHDWM